MTQIVVPPFFQFVARAKPERDGEEKFVFFVDSSSLLLANKPFERERDHIVRLIHDQQDQEQEQRENIRFRMRFTFDRTSFAQAQSAFFERQTKYLAQLMFQRINSTIFIFGARDSGRSFTFLGNPKEKGKVGLVLRLALEILLQIAFNKHGVKHALFMTLTIFHNNNFFDTQRSGFSVDSNSTNRQSPINSKTTPKSQNSNSNSISNSARESHYIIETPRSRTAGRKNDRIRDNQRERESVNSIDREQLISTRKEGKNGSTEQIWGSQQYTSAHALRVRKDPERGTVLDGVCCRRITSVDDVMMMLDNASDIINKKSKKKKDGERNDQFNSSSNQSDRSASPPYSNRIGSLNSEFTRSNSSPSNVFSPTSSHLQRSINSNIDSAHIICTFELRQLEGREGHIAKDVPPVKMNIVRLSSE
ncbi:MAG: hypothetical protein EZS28_024899, partial [Streblomastix strix]